MSRTGRDAAQHETMTMTETQPGPAPAADEPAPRQRPKSRINLGLNALRRDNPWPEFGYGEIEPFYLPLDGGGRGGREIIVDILRQRRIRLMVEVGCFLGGSTLQWLRAVPDLTVIGVDPWDLNSAAYLEEIAQDPLRARTVYHLTEEQLATICSVIRRHGNFCVAMNNLRLHKARFIPVRRRAPEAFAYLKKRAIEPELIYIDADKRRDDLEEAHRLFPEAILCGDDWLWPDEAGVLRMQVAVKGFAADHGFEVRSSRQSWLLLPRAPAVGAEPAAAGAAC